MAIALRLSRGGAKKRPYYRIVAADSRYPRDGRYLEQIGTYNPLLAKDDEKRVQLNEDRAKYWLGVGAQPSEAVPGWDLALRAMRVGERSTTSFRTERLAAIDRIVSEVDAVEQSTNRASNRGDKEDTLSSEGYEDLGRQGCEE